MLEASFKEEAFMINLGRTALALFAALALPLSAQVRLTGTVSEWYGGAPGVSPKKRALAGATVVAGADLQFDTGRAGGDTIRGKVAAKAVTDGKGGYVLNLPAGRYTMVFWKAGYTPQVDNRVVAPGTRDVEISVDKSMQGLHRSLGYK